ncbi:hypothetical protein FRC15_006530 [Serendipita sp. 397]|nr:hypothetical protein FRC15_006530 [Serendipita sp. 397]
MVISLPHDILVSIIRDYQLDKETLCSLSLVSRSFCEAAQGVLFRRVNLSHDSRNMFTTSWEMDEVLPRFKWKKLQFIANCTRLHRSIRSLCVMIYSSDQLPTHVKERYWKEGGGRALLDELDRWLPRALKRMSALSQFFYSGPPMRAPLHRTILRHATLEVLHLMPKTWCAVPCENAVKRARSTSIHCLQFEEIGDEVEAFGIPPYPIGPRQCAYTTHMIFTHAASLQTIIAPITLLYDAIRCFRNLPELPRLSTLNILNSRLKSSFLPSYPTMTAEVVRLILLTSKTLVKLLWGQKLVEEMTSSIATTQMPNLDVFAGYGVLPVVKAAQSLRVLGVRGFRPNDIDAETNISLLRAASRYQPNLSVLSVSTSTRAMIIPLDICVFSNITELWYDETVDCTVFDEQLTDDIKYDHDFLGIVLPALPKLKSVCLTQTGGMGFSLPRQEDYAQLSLTSSQSLLWLTLQRIYSRLYWRWDTRRKDLECSWVHTTFYRFEDLRHFDYQE